MKAILLIITVVVGQSVLAADKKPKVVPNSEAAMQEFEANIRYSLGKERPGSFIKDPLPKNVPLTVDHLESMDEVVLNRCGLSDIRVLAKFKNVKTLYLINNKVTDLSPLAKLTKLEKLMLGSNEITDISPLAKLTRLERLDIDGNEISDLSPLAKLTKLKQLNISFNSTKLTLSQVEELRKALPSCKIRHNVRKKVDPLLFNK